MNKKNEASLLSGDIHPHNVPYKLNQLPYKPIITVAVDKLTKITIGFSIKEAHVTNNVQTHVRQVIATPINYTRNSIPHHFADIPNYAIDDGSTEFCSTIFAKALKKFHLQLKPASDNRIVRRIEIDYFLADVFVTLSLRLRENPRPSPKKPPFGELWRQRGHRFP
ncbi:hypothetical protein [Pseudomonas fluorescens]|uniref:hypothetical protein n=1 Tax=Pseudomonas fluorescens TaxID=294 RepID=UPI002B1E4C90|nr:hypothetical protein [Pseudomonas fluorescens]